MLSFEYFIHSTIGPLVYRQTLMSPAAKKKALKTLTHDPAQGSHDSSPRVQLISEHRGYFYGGIGHIGVWGAASFQMDDLVKGQKVKMNPSEPPAELQAGKWRFGPCTPLVTTWLGCSYSPKERAEFSRKLISSKLEAGLFQSDRVRQAQSLLKQKISRQPPTPTASNTYQFRGALNGLPKCISSAGPGSQQKVSALKLGVRQKALGRCGC